MKNKMQDLRNHLFETLEALKDPDHPMEVARGKAVANVAQTIINTAKVELDVFRETGRLPTGFIDMDEKPGLPSSVSRIGLK